MPTENTPIQPSTSVPPAATPAVVPASVPTPAAIDTAPTTAAPASAPVSTATTTAAPAPAAKKLGFVQKGQLLFKKYQNMNGKNMPPAEAEAAARKDLGLPPLSEVEAKALAEKPNRFKIVKKIMDNKGKIIAAVGTLAVARKKLGFFKKKEGDAETTPTENSATIPPAVPTPPKTEPNSPQPPASGNPPV